MEERTKAAFDVEATKVGDSLTELKLRVAEHVIAQDDRHETDVRAILAETKVGAWRKSDLWKKLEVIFTAT